MTVEFRFNIHDRVRIPELDRSGLVLALYVSETGKQYSVRYFDNGKAETVYLYESEITPQEPKATIGICLPSTPTV